MALFISAIVGLLLVGVDQWTKLLAIAYLKEQEALVLWEGVFELKYCENPGVAFSLLEHQEWVFIPITIIAMLLMVVVLIRSKLCSNFLFRASCVLIIAGGIGNLIDRIMYGYVVDFLYFRLINFPIFNFADCCVVVGAIVLIAYLLFGYKEQKGDSLLSIFFGITKRKGEGSDV